MCSMRVGGLISGLDTEALMNQLMTLERRPLVVATEKRQTLEWKKAAWGEINTQLLALKTSADSLLNRVTMLGRKATSGDEKVLTASATSEAAAGTYSVTVTRLASSTRVTGGFGALNLGVGAKIDQTKAFTDPAAKFGVTPTAGKFTINGVQIEVLDTDSLDAVITKINSSTAGVTASYDAVSDTFKVAANGAGDPLNLGSSADTSNFLTATAVLSAERSGDEKVSAIHLGRINPNQSLKDANFATAVTADVNGNGSFKINGVEIKYNVNTDTLNKIITRINNSGANVTASYDATTDRVLLSSKSTGSLSVSREDVTGNFLGSVDLLNGATTTAGDSAQFTIEGFNVDPDTGVSRPITRSTNTVSDVITGVTLNLIDDPGTPTTVTVSQDGNAVKNAIKGFIFTYNKTMDLINGKLSEQRVKEPLTTDDKKKGLMSGEPILIQLKRDMATSVVDPVAGLPSAMSRLANIGIQLDKTDYGKSGHLVLDEAKLDAALRDDQQGVANLFFMDADADNVVDTSKTGGAETGVAVKFSNLLNKLTDTTTTSLSQFTIKAGQVPRVQEALDKQIADIKKYTEDFEERLELREQGLYRQFAAMETAMQKMQSQSSWLQSQLASLL